MDIKKENMKYIIISFISFGILLAASIFSQNKGYMHSWNNRLTGQLIGFFLLIGFQLIRFNPEAKNSKKYRKFGRVFLIIMNVLMLILTAINLIQVLL